MRILIDTDVIMDFLMKRGSFSDDAEKMIAFCMREGIQGAVAAHTIPNLFYILRTHYTKEERRDVLLKLCKMFMVVGIDANKLESALCNTSFSDFEDCLQMECAKDFEADFIVTRNVKDFLASPIPVIEPTELVRRLA